MQTLGYDVVTNRPKVAAYRAPGAPIGAFAVECVLDELAAKLGIDPLELRQKNAAKEGTKAAHGPIYPIIGYQETLKQAHAHRTSGAARAQPGPRHRQRLLVQCRRRIERPVNVNEDGTVVVMTGHPDIGGSRASMAMIAAELLGIDHASPGADRRHQLHRLQRPDRRQPRHLRHGMAVTQAAEKVIENLSKRAAMIWEIEPDAVIWDNGEARPAGANAGDFEPLSLAEIAAKASGTGGPISAELSINTRAPAPASRRISATSRSIPRPAT